MKRWLLAAVLWTLSFVLSPAQERKEGSLYECDVEIENSLTFPSVRSRASGIGTRHLFVIENGPFAFSLGARYRYCEYLPKVTTTGSVYGLEVSPSSFQDHQVVVSCGIQYRFDNIRKLRKSLQPYLSLEAFLPVSPHRELAVSGFVDVDGEQLHFINEYSMMLRSIEAEVGAAFTVGRWGSFYIGLGLDCPPSASTLLLFENGETKVRLSSPMVLLKIGKRFDVWRFKSDNGGRIDVEIYGE